MQTFISPQGTLSLNPGPPKYSFLKDLPRNRTSQNPDSSELKLAKQSNTIQPQLLNITAMMTGSFPGASFPICNGQICSKEKMFSMTLWPRGLFLQTQKTENEFVSYFLLNTRKVLWLVKKISSLFNIPLLVHVFFKNIVENKKMQFMLFCTYYHQFHTFSREKCQHNF